MFNDICRELGFTLSEKAYAYGSRDEEDVEEIIESCDIRGGYVYGSVSGELENAYVEYGEVYREISGTSFGSVSGQYICC